jgi:type IV secretory pathway VirB10-like protein
MVEPDIVSGAPNGSAPESAIARDLRLRAAPASVTRLSRKVLIALGATASLAIVGAVGWAMAQKPQGRGQGELYQTGGQQPPDAMAALPSDYANTTAAADTPKLGPPLPGDLGRPMLAAGQTGTSPLASPPPNATATPDPAQQQLGQERDAARTSRLFTGEGAAREGAAAQDLAAAAAQSPPPPPAPASPPANLAGQAGNLAFLSAPADRQTVSTERVQAPASPYVVQAGTVIPAALITGLRSDLPGQITAQVTENVYDSPTGRYLLIPQGARLIGDYDSQVAFGQSRVLLAWTRLILPGGRSIVLDKQPGADVAGFAGLEDGVDHHWKQLFSAALLSTLLGVGAEAGASQSDSQILEALRQGAANSMNQVGQQVVGRSLDVQPTLTIRPGFPVRVMVTRDLVLEPLPR